MFNERLEGVEKEKFFEGVREDREGLRNTLLFCEDLLSAHKKHGVSPHIYTPILKNVVGENGGCTTEVNSGYSFGMQKMQV